MPRIGARGSAMIHSLLATKIEELSKVAILDVAVDLLKQLEGESLSDRAVVDLILNRVEVLAMNELATKSDLAAVRKIRKSIDGTLAAIAIARRAHDDCTGESCVRCAGWAKAERILRGDAQ